MAKSTWLPGLLLLASCSLFGGSGGGNATAYTECNNPAGRAAWGEARMALTRGDRPAALPHLIEATSNCPNLVRAHIAYQDIAREVGGDAEQAMVDFYVKETEAAAKAGSPVPAYMRARLAETAYAQSNALDAILASHETFAWGHLSRGRVNRGQGRLSEALQNLDQAISLDDKLIEARLERAQVLVELGRDMEAAVEYRAYWDANPADTAAAREYLTLLLYRLEDHVDEASQLIDYLQRSDQSLALRMDRAAVLWRGGRADAAIEVYLEILEQDPKMARAALNIGLLYYEVVPKEEVDKIRYWPKARAAFQLFMQKSDPQDGHEQFERTWAVPYRLRRIGELLGPATVTPTLELLRWPK